LIFFIFPKPTTLFVLSIIVLAFQR